MITKIKEDNRTIRIVTQQYEVGTYVAIYNDKTGEFLDQFGVQCTEEEYHKEIREKFKDDIVE